jgi:hypothetical protein
MKRKLLTETPVCPRERLVIIRYTTGLSFAKERIMPLAAIITTVFYLLALYLFALSNTPENPFASIYSETLIKTTSQHLLLLIGFDTLIYRKYYDTPPILVGHHRGSHRGCMWIRPEAAMAGMLLMRPRRISSSRRGLVGGWERPSQRLVGQSWRRPGLGDLIFFFLYLGDQCVVRK